MLRTLAHHYCCFHGGSATSVPLLRLCQLPEQPISEHTHWHRNGTDAPRPHSSLRVWRIVSRRQ